MKTRTFIASAAALLLAGLFISTTGVAAPREEARKRETTRTSPRRAVKKAAVRFEGRRKTRRRGTLPYREMAEAKPPTKAPTKAPISKSDLTKPAVPREVMGPVTPDAAAEPSTYQWHSPAKLAAAGRVQVVDVPSLEEWSPTGIQTKGMVELKVTPPAGKSLLLECGVQQASGPSPDKAVYALEPLAPMKSLPSSAGVLKLVVSSPTTLKISKHPTSVAKGIWQLNGCETTLK